MNRLLHWGRAVFLLPLTLLDIRRELQSINKRTIEMQHTLDDVLNEVRAESTLIASLSAFVTGLRKQVTDALASSTSNADAQAKIDAIFDTVKTNEAGIAQAVADNTPAANVDPTASGTDGSGAASSGTGTTAGTDTTGATGTTGTAAAGSGDGGAAGDGGGSGT